MSTPGNEYSVDIDAAALGNGCTPETELSEATAGVRDAPRIGPAPNVHPRP